jgi:hypothetical protein
MEKARDSTGVVESVRTVEINNFEGEVKAIRVGAYRRVRFASVHEL